MKCVIKLACVRPSVPLEVLGVLGRKLAALDRAGEGAEVLPRLRLRFFDDDDFWGTLLDRNRSGYRWCRRCCLGGQSRRRTRIRGFILPEQVLLGEVDADVDVVVGERSDTGCLLPVK